MERIVKKCEKYLFANLGINVDMAPWKEQEQLPYFMQDSYGIYTCVIALQRFLVMVSRGEEESTPTTIRKHLVILEAHGDAECFYLHKNISSYNRKRLIEQKVPFVVPNNQMYLPALGLDLREHLRTLRTKAKIKKVSPSTQVVLLSLIYGNLQKPITPSLLVKKLGYAAMTMTRAFDEIETLGLASMTVHSGVRELQLQTSPKQLWKAALPYLRSPIKKVEMALEPPLLNSLPLLAGETALEQRTTLHASGTPRYAVSQDEWQGMLDEWMNMPLENQSPASIEIWKYDPKSITRDGKTVDPLSLYLSLQDIEDERVEQAVNDVLREVL